MPSYREASSNQEESPLSNIGQDLASAKHILYDTNSWFPYLLST